MDHPVKPGDDELGDYTERRPGDDELEELEDFRRTGRRRWVQPCSHPSSLPAQAGNPGPPAPVFAVIERPPTPNEPPWITRTSRVMTGWRDSAEQATDGCDLLSPSPVIARLDRATHYAAPLASERSVRARLKALLFAPVIFVLLVPDAKAETVEFLCSFDRMCDSTLSCRRSDPFEFKIVLDTITEDAFLFGAQGATKVFLVDGSLGISLLEPLITGAVQSTTIMPSGEAVHSRHTLLPDEIISSQYYGTCRTEPTR